MKRVLKLFVVALVLLAGTGAALFWGLVERLPLASPPRARVPLPADVDARLRSVPGAPLDVRLEAATTIDGHRVVPGRISVQRPVGAHENGDGTSRAWTTRFELWLADGAAGPRPTLVVTPILGGDNEIERIIADDLASHGFHACIVDRKIPPEPTFANFEAALADMIATRRRVIDWLETRPDVDARRIGAYGVSLGGITTAMLAAVEPRLRASIVVMAGGDFAEVVSRSVEGEAFSLRHNEGLPDGAPEDARLAFVARGRGILRTCPVALGRHADPASILMFLTRRDTSVPPDTQVRLRDALGGPEALSLPTGHYSAIIYLKLILGRAREFLTRRFAERSDS